MTNTTAIEEILRKYAVDDLGESVIRGIVADLADLETRVREEEHTNLVSEIKWWLFEYGKFDNEDLLNFKKQFELSQKGTDDKTD